MRCFYLQSESTQVKNCLHQRNFYNDIVGTSLTITTAQQEPRYLLSTL